MSPAGKHPPRAEAGLLLGVAAVALVPFLRGLLRGESLYFRDLARHFLPLRLYALEGLRDGELRYWNPLLHGGIPVPFPPLWGPLELLGLLRPGEALLSLALVLHLAIAAAGMAWLMRRFGAHPAGAATAGLVYALGGFALSTLNLYVYVQTLAWTPLAIGGLHAAARHPRALLPATLAVGLLVNTAGIELVAQALLAGVLLAAPFTWRSGARVAATGALGAALAAPTLLVMAGVAALSQRAGGFSTDVVLAYSIHPFTFLQVLVSDLYGDTGRLTDLWWGANFFPRGFPYFLSLYLGAPVVALAAAGARGPTPARRRLLALLVLGVVVGLGRWGVVEPLVDAFAALRAVRNPGKAFFSVHLAVAMLAGWGVSHIALGDRAALRRSAGLLGGAGVALLLPLAAPLAAPAATRWFVEHFFPPAMAAPARGEALGHMLASAALGGGLALAGALLVVLAARGRLPAARAALLLSALAAGDLVRAGAGLNPTVAAGFFVPSPPARALLPALQGGGRVFTCEPTASAAYWRARAERPQDHETWTFAVYIDTFTPDANMRDSLPTALSEDMTSLVPVAATLGPEEGCARLDALLPRLREAGVGRVLSVEPLRHPELRPRAVAHPPRTAPLAVFAYEVTAPAAHDEAVTVVEHRPGQILVRVDLPAAREVVIDEGWAPGWRAEVDGRPLDVREGAGRRLTFSAPAGVTTVRLAYRPPGLRAGLGAAGLALLVLAGAAARQRRRGAVDAPPPSG